MLSSYRADSEVFDIFSGSSDRDAVWVEAVTGLDQTKRRMHQIAAEKPGDYFIFCATTNSILDKMGNRARSHIENTPDKADIA